MRAVYAFRATEAGSIGKFGKENIGPSGMVNDVTKDDVSHRLHWGEDKKRAWKVVPK